MDRGQGGRPAHGTDETIDAIEAVGATADEDASDEPIEDGTPTDVPASDLAVVGGPPAHWLAYIRARAPWLLRPGGLLGETADPARRDVVPHGPGAQVAPWPVADPSSGASAVAKPGSPSFGEVGTGRPGRGGDGRRDDGRGEDPDGGAARGGGSVPLAGLPAVGEGVAEAVIGDRPVAFEAPGGRRVGTPGDRDDPAEGPYPGEAVAAPSTPAFGAVGAPDVLADERAAAWRAADSRDAGRDARATPAVPPIPSSDTSGPRPRPVSWPAPTPPGPVQVNAPRSETWPPSVDRAARPVPPVPGPEAADVPGTAPRSPAFAPPPHHTRPDAAPSAYASGGWRVRATAPETSLVARLALPPWPDLPELPPDDRDDTDWRAIERRLQRAARLDHEQRRR